MTTNSETVQLEATFPEAYKYVSRVAYKEDEVLETTPLKVPDFQGVPTARVTVSAHMTKNLGNYESAKIGIEVSLPCFPTQAEIVRAADEAQVLISELLNEQLTALEN